MGNEEKQLAYKIVLEDNLFKFGFAEVEKDTEKVKILTEFALDDEGFKKYFQKIIEVMNEFNITNNRNLVREILE